LAKELAEAKNDLANAKPDEIKADLKALDDYRIALNKRRKAKAEQRAELEKAPKVEML
jgi:hypothetical protein